MTSELFVRTCELAMALGHRQINQQPGCLELQVDDDLWCAINPHTEETMCSRESAPIPPFTIFFECHGMPAAIVSSSTGATLFGSEDELLQRVRAALDRAEAGNAVQTEGAR